MLKLSGALLPRNHCGSALLRRVGCRQLTFERLSKAESKIASRLDELASISAQPAVGCGDPTPRWLQIHRPEFLAKNRISRRPRPLPPQVLVQTLEKVRRVVLAAGMTEPTSARDFFKGRHLT